jgi:protein O-GlcNAc transferase
MSERLEGAVKSALDLHRSGRVAEAEKLYTDIIRAEPGNGQALYLLGFLHFQKGAFGEAERLMGVALALDPNVPDALYNRAIALTKLRRNAEAVPLLDRLLDLHPGIAEAWHYRGMALSGIGKEEDALFSYGKALSLRSMPETLHNRANVLFSLKRYGEAAEDYAAVLELKPDIPYARGSMVFARLHACDWRGLKDQRALIAVGVREGRRVVQPGAMLAISGSPGDQRRAAEIWNANEVPSRAEAFKPGERRTSEKIRVAYVSADFGSHAVAYLIAGVMEAHDKSRFDITAVSLSGDDGSSIRKRIASACGRMIEVGSDDDIAVARRLREMDIDIAIDLMGYTGGSRMGIFAARAARVQAVFLGFPGTAGAPYMDYLLADETIVPAHARLHYRERIAYLPDCYLPPETGLEPASPPSRPQAGLPEKGFVFCSFCNSYKISPEIFSLWMRLLSSVDGSVLWLKPGNEEAMGNLKREAAARGIAPERLIFAPAVPSRADHRARLALAGLCLDTLPYGGHATALDALSAGLPVLTCLGDAFAGRVAGSLLRAAGIPELAVRSLEEYEAAALRLAANSGELDALKAKLAKNRNTAPLFDHLRYTRGLEAAYMAMLEGA